MTMLSPAADGHMRCHWAVVSPADLAYHDTEWGRPIADDTRLFESLCLEAFQSGLSWRTILAKRAAFRAAFVGFDIDRVAAFDATDVQRLLTDPGIVRHRGKIEAVINNARCARTLIASEGSLARFFWRHEPRSDGDAPKVAAELSRVLKKQGWKFMGPTTILSFLQAAGLCNAHADGCATRAATEAARAGFTRPLV